MDFHQLEYFISVAKTENMGSSAEILHISQPALSMSIKRLEEELGTPLFDRRNHSIRLNSLGRLFLRYAEESINTIEDGKKELTAAVQRKNNKVKISCPVFYLTGSIFEAFLAINPESSIEYCSAQYWQAEEMIMNGSIDVLLSTVPAHSEYLDNKYLADRRMGVICSKEHPFAQRSEISISELRNEKFVSYSDVKQPRYDLELICSKQGFKPNIVFESDALLTLLSMCRKNIGLFSTSGNSTKYMDMTDLVFVPFNDNDEDAHIKLYIISRKDNRRPLVTDLIDVITDSINEE